MGQVERTDYTPEQAILLAMKTLRSTHPDTKVLAKIEEIEAEARAAADKAFQHGKATGRRARRKAAKRGLAEA